LTSQPAEDRVLADALAAYVLDVYADPNLYEKVRRWHRRRRQLRVTGSVALASVVAAAVTIAVATGSLPQAAPRPAPAASTPTPVYTHPNGVRGSLGGDQQLIDSAGRAVLAESMGRKGSDPRPDSLRAFYAERTGKVTVVMFTGTSKQDSNLTFHGLATRTGTGRWEGTWSSGPRRSAGVDVGRAQQWDGEPFLMLDTLVGSRTYLAIVVPPGVTAGLARGLDVAADGTPKKIFWPVELHAGTALLDVSTGPSVSGQLSQRGRVISHWTRSGQQDGGGAYLADDSVYPTAAQQHAAAAAARGTVDPKALTEAVASLGMDAQRFAGAHMRFRVVWGGRIDGESCVLVAMQFDSGALLPELTCLEAGGGTGSVLPGTVSAGAMDRTVLAWSVTSQVQVMAPPGAVRAEIVYANHSTLPVPLDNGYGMGPQKRDGAVATTVRVYAAGGRLLDQRAVDEGVHD
jgi:hypothetical protein